MRRKKKKKKKNITINIVEKMKKLIPGLLLCTACLMQQNLWANCTAYTTINSGWWLTSLTKYRKKGLPNDVYNHDKIKTVRQFYTLMVNNCTLYIYSWVISDSDESKLIEDRHTVWFLLLCYIGSYSCKIQQ